MTRNDGPFWGLLAVGAATAVGVTTHDAGFVAITFIGSLVLPRVLGLRGHRAHGHGPCGGHRHDARSRLEQRLGDWHHQAHSDAPATPTDPAPVA
jgi:hypothetical protein